jgi:hypothetical protein
MGSVMKNVTAEMANKASQKAQSLNVTSENTALDCHYGQIGISAVLAASRYNGVAKKPAYAPAADYWYDRAGETAA